MTRRRRPRPNRPGGGGGGPGGILNNPGGGGTPQATFTYQGPPGGWANVADPSTWQEPAEGWAPTGNFFDVPEGFDPVTGTIVAPAAPAEPAEDPWTQDRLDVWGAVEKVFANLGLPAGEMTAFIRGQVLDGQQDWQIVDAVRQQQWYRDIFVGMDELLKRGDGWDEQRYIQQRLAYQEALKDMPQGFYDEPKDFANWILSDVAPEEVKRRADFAKMQLAQADPEFKKALKDMYGIQEDGMAAYLLDPERATAVIDRQMRAASITRFALENSNSIDTQTAERIANSAGAAGIDALSGAGQEEIMKRMGSAAAVDKADSLLSAIDNESYSFADSVEAAFGDTQKQLASQKRGERERARFSGTSGVARTSLSKKRGY